jgi:hypothetical protein
MARRLPWDEMRAAYVMGAAIDPDRDPHRRSWPTLDEVAQLFGASPGIVRTRSGNEGWVAQREQFQAESETARRRWLIEDRAERATRVDDRSLQVAEAGMALVGTRLTVIIRAQEGQVPDLRGLTVDARELAALGLAAKRFVDVKAHVMGQPSTAPEDSLDELERRQRVEERKIADELAAFLEERRAEAAADVDGAAPLS